MSQAHAAPPFADPALFRDIDAATLALEEWEEAGQSPDVDRPWDVYLRRVLRPTNAQAGRLRLVSLG